MASRVVSVIWFTTGPNTIGVIKTVNIGLTEVNYRIGVGKGENEADDVRMIKDYGAKFPKEAGDALFNSDTIFTTEWTPNQ